MRLILIIIVSGFVGMGLDLYGMDWNPGFWLIGTFGGVVGCFVEFNE